MRTKAIWLTVVALLAGACARGGAGGDGPRVVPLGGEVFLLDGDERTSVDQAEDIAPGTTVGTGEDGSARVVLTEGRAVELGPESTLRVESLSSTELLTGRALVAAPSGLEVTSGAARIEGSGDFRLDRYVGALRLGVYAGSATVQGWDGRVSSLEQVGVAAGIVPKAPVPLQVDPSDAWDSRKLGDAIDIGRELDDLQRGLRPQLAGDASPTVLAGVLPPAFPTKASEGRFGGVQPAEALVAAMVALQAAREQGGSILSTLRQVLALRELGASWIIVVARWELYTEAILTGLARISALMASILVPVVAGGGTDAPAPPASTGAPVTGGTSGPVSSAPSTDTGDSGGGGTVDQPPDDGGGTGGGGTGGGGSGGGEACGTEVECAVDDVIGETGLDDALGLNP